MIKLGGGKNSFWSKPLGTGKKSVAHNPLNISPLHAYGKEAVGSAFKIFGGGAQGSVNSLSKGDVIAAMEEGERKGEVVAGTTAKEAGEGRQRVRQNLEQILKGDSIGANRLRESQSQQAKQMKAQQAYGAGQGGQMAAGQQAQLGQQQNRQLADYLFTEQRQTLSDLSKEYRGAGSDIMKMSGQYGSILTASQPPAQPNYGGGGLLSNIFGGIL